MLYDTVIGVPLVQLPLRNALVSLEVWKFDYFERGRILQLDSVSLNTYPDSIQPD